jgi:hypothetical protein
MVCDCVDSVLAQKGVALDVVIISKSLFARLYDTSGIETMKIMCYNAMK